MSAAAGGPALAVLDAAAVRRSLGPAAAVDALEAALLAGLDPEADPPRVVTEVPAGQLLLMPASDGRRAGVKVASVAPGNAARGLPRVQGGYLLMDGPTLTPLALLDGVELTLLRTAAVSALAVRHLAADRPLATVVFGTGPQARRHLEAVAAVRPLAEVAVVGRDPARVAALVEAAGAWCARARAGSAADVAGADLVVCCTSAAEPLFDSAPVRAGAVVVAMGSHTPGDRELDAALVRRSRLVVEGRGAALREAGDLLQAFSPAELGAVVLDDLAGLVRGRTAPGAQEQQVHWRPQVFKSVGMAWEDLVVAGAVLDAWTAEAAGPRAGGRRA